MSLDIFKPTISVVSRGMEGKTILIHSNERKLGKTYQATRFPKPYYLRFEQGINAISGIPYAPLNKWSDFKKINRALTNPKTVDKAREMYSTIIIDTTDVAIKWCDKYVCNAHGVSRLNDGNDGFGLWKEYENEWFNEWNKLLNAGFCLVFISHSEIRKMVHPITGEEYEQLYPKGDKRTIDLIIDAADYIGYVKSNGFTEDGEIQMSSIYFAACPEFLAGSRFKYMPNEITPFTAEAVQEAIAQAVVQEEAEKGIESVTFAQFAEQSKGEEVTYEDAMEEVKPLFQEMCGLNKEKAVEIVESHLGIGNKLSGTTEKQLEQVLIIIDDLKEAIDDYEEVE